MPRPKMEKEYVKQSRKKFLATFTNSRFMRLRDLMEAEIEKEVDRCFAEEESVLPEDHLTKEEFENIYNKALSTLSGDAASS